MKDGKGHTGLRLGPDVGQSRRKCPVTSGTLELFFRVPDVCWVGSARWPDGHVAGAQPAGEAGAGGAAVLAIRIQPYSGRYVILGDTSITGHIQKNLWGPVQWLSS